MNAPAWRLLVDRSDPALPVVAQCRLLGIARATLYYRPAPVSVQRIFNDYAAGLSPRSIAKQNGWTTCSSAGVS